jgi:8-oxo-dGTP pyrophosphatase MutT (NUDIX family)
MMKEIVSAGGVVLKGTGILMLKKANGDWVLPKGRIEEKESDRHAALREVREETGIRARVIRPIGEIEYRYLNVWQDDETIHKTVFWFLMAEIGGRLMPQKNEGFIEARYVSEEVFEACARHEDEKRMIRKALALRS